MNHLRTEVEIIQIYTFIISFSNHSVIFFQKVHVHQINLVKSFPTNIRLRKSVSLPPRTSLSNCVYFSSYEVSIFTNFTLSRRRSKRERRSSHWVVVNQFPFFENFKRTVQIGGQLVERFSERRTGRSD